MESKTLFVFATAILFFVFNQESFSANERFRSVASGNWNTTTIWEMSTNNGSTWFAATSTPTDTSGLINIRNTNTVQITVNVTANQLTVEAGGMLTINSSIILTILPGTGDDLTTLSGSIVNGSGKVRTQGTIEINVRDGSAFNAELNVNTGSAIARDFSSPFVGKVFGTVTIDSGAVLNTGNISGTGTWFYGNVVNNGTLSATSTGGFIRIKGTSLLNNGSINAAGHFYFDTTTSLSGAGSFTSANQWISPNGKISLLSNVTITPSAGLTMLTGGAVLNINGFVMTFNSGEFIVNAGSTVNGPGTVRTQNNVAIYTGNNSAFNADIKVNNGFLTSGTTSPDRIFGNVTIDNGASYNCGWSSGRRTDFYGNITNNGTLYTSSTGGSIRIKGPSLVNNGSINAAGHFYFDTTTSLSGAGSFTSANQWISPNGKISLLSNVTITPSAGLTMLTGGAVLNINGFVMTFNSGQFILNAGNTVNGPGTVRTQNNVAIYTGNSSDFNADINVNNGFLTSGTTSTDRVLGNVTIDNGASYNCGWSSGRRTDFYGNIINNGTLYASSVGGSIRIKGPSLVNNGLISLASSNFYFDTTTSLSGTGSFTSHANFSGNANVTLNSAHQMLSITVNTGTVFNITSRLLRVTASNPIGVSGTFNTTASTVEYNGAALQSVSVTNINYYGLRINNPAGATLLGNITIPDTLSIILGKLNLNGRIITLNPTAYMTETPNNVVFGTTGYITTTRTLGTPTGLNVGGMGAVLTSTTSLGNTEIRRGHTVQTGLNGGTSIRRYYDITPANNTGLNATLVYKFDDSELSGKPKPSLKLFKSTNTGSNWTFQGGTVNIATNEITLAGLTSFSRWSADSSGVSAAIGLIMEGFYNIPTNNLNMTDTVRAYLRNTSSPFAVIDEAVGILDSLTFRSALQFTTAVTGSYYIQLNHRNSLETWSKNPINYIKETTLNYDFTTAATQAFGNNEVQKGTKYCLYSGDINQDGLIDLKDVILINNASSVFTTGYVATDANGNSIVDLTDVLIASNNANLFVSKKSPLNP